MPKAIAHAMPLAGHGASALEREEPERRESLRHDALARLAATLDTKVPTDAVPPLWHWTSFLGCSPTSELGPDGHPPKSALYPPQPRRMFAGGRMRVISPLPIEYPIVRRSTVGEVRYKQGRDGPLSFVTVTHNYLVDGSLAVREEQDLVYRSEADGHSVGPARTGYQDNDAARDPQWRQKRTFSAAHLFRFSALTFNAHRIHYDLPYATQVEGYPGLVVQGPLLAICLLDLIREDFGDFAVASLDFRATAPAFVNEELEFVGWPGADMHSIELSARRAGRQLMKATAQLSSEVGS